MGVGGKEATPRRADGMTRQPSTADPCGDYFSSILFPRLMVNVTVKAPVL